MFLSLANSGYYKYLIIILLIPVHLGLFAQPNEHLIKAIYFEKFSRFTEWPVPNKLQTDDNIFSIVVIGDNMFHGLIEEVYKEQKIGGKKVEVSYIREISQLKNAQILFIGKVSDEELTKILAYTANKPIMTISETPGYAQKGVLVNFYLFENKIRFEINESAVKRSGLSIDFRLLSFAKIINPIKTNP